MHEARTSILGQVWCRVAFASDHDREGSGAPTLIAPPSPILWPQWSSNRSGVRASQQAGQSGAVKSKLLQAVEAWFVLASTGPMTRHVFVMILGKRVWEECVVLLTGDGREYGAARRNRELKKGAATPFPPSPGARGRHTQGFRAPPARTSASRRRGCPRRSRAHHSCRLPRLPPWRTVGGDPHPRETGRRLGTFLGVVIIAGGLSGRAYGMTLRLKMTVHDR